MGLHLECGPKDRPGLVALTLNSKMSIPTGSTAILEIINPSQ